MIDNFEQIRNLLTFPNENSFYFLEIIKRRKENPEMLKHASLVRDFYIHSLKEFDEAKGKIVELCNQHNARAYFRLNLRDAKKIAFLYNKRLAELLITEDYKNIPRAYASVAGEFHSDEDKKWLIDLDGSGEDFQKLSNDIIARITEIYVSNQRTETYKNPIIANIPTKNGIHLITRPFRLDVFKEEFPNIEVHKNNPTILYCP